MTIKRFKVPLYEYKVIVVMLPAKTDEEYVNILNKLLKYLGASEEHIDETVQDFKNGDTNGGVHFYNFKKTTSAIIVYHCTSHNKLIEVIAHESRHLVDRIMEWGSIKDHEAAAYLSGFIAVKMSQFVKN